VDAGGGVRVVDDYGHNPAKLAAAWAAVAAPGNRVLGVWRPHGFGPLRAMLDPLTDAFAAVCRAQDKLWLLPVYDAGGTTDRTIQFRRAGGRALQARGVAVESAETMRRWRGAGARGARRRHDPDDGRARSAAAGLRAEMAAATAHL
jgi:UDP-N-acetylmuramate-alanine ligase